MSQKLLGSQISGTIVASWIDGKIAADELSFTITVARENNGRQMAQDTVSNFSDLNR
jgi:hypothetical protein